MTSLQWSKRYSVHIAPLDDDHRNLFQALNELWVAAERGFALDILMHTLDSALALMMGHFRREEELMVSFLYPRLQKHRIEHRRLLSRLDSLRQAALGAPQSPALLRGIAFLQRRFGLHILKSDKHFSRHIVARRDRSVSSQDSGSEVWSPNQGSQHSWGWQVVLTIALGLTASIFLFLAIQNSEREGAVARFHELADQHIIAIRSNIDLAIDSVSLIVGHFSVAGPTSTSRADFRRMVTPTLTKHPYIQGYSWDPRIRGADLAEFERVARREGPVEFRVFERDSEGKPRPVTNRDEYVPVFYMEPAATNASAIGFDLASNPVRRKALDEARDNAKPIVTARITLVQETGSQFGVLVLAPVFATEPSSNIAERRSLLTGYVSGVFRIGDLIESSKANLETSRNADVNNLVHVQLFDRSAPPESQLLYPSMPNQSLDELVVGMHVISGFQIAGRIWQLVVTPTSAFLKNQTSINGPITLVFGIFLTGLMAYTMKAKTAQIERESLYARKVAQVKQRQSEAHRIARLGFIEFDSSSGQWLLGEGADELLGIEQTLGADAIVDVLAKIDVQGRKQLEDFIRSGGAQHLELEFQVADRTISAVGQLCNTDYGSSPILITLQDVTARREAEYERAKMLERLGEANKFESLGTLAGGIAHEINTPAQYVGDNLRFLQSGIKTLLEVARKANEVAVGADKAILAEQLAGADLDFLSAELPDASAQALEGIDRIGEIVRAIKEFSHPSSKHPSPFDLNRVIEASATVTKNQWKYVADLDLKLDPALPLINAIEGEINQVLLNLLVNAAQAIAEKASGTQGHITVTTRQIDGSVEISIADTGVGIPADKHHKIFEMFYTTKPPGEGTGQGLAIVYSIVRRHGGTISVESEPGEGALFRVVLPISGAPLDSATSESSLH